MKMSVVFPIQGEDRRFEAKHEEFEPCQRGEASDYRVGWNVSGVGNPIEFKMDEVSSGQK